ncbi:MAG: hydantoinase/oxoprolinase family protein [Pseudomonadota bacterium]
MAMVKTPTTAHDLTVCFMACLEAGAARLGLSLENLLFETEIIRFSNTIGTNTIIQRNGAKVGLLVTKGSEDLAPTRRGAGGRPLIEPELVLGIEEETDPAGRVVLVPDEKDIMAAAQELIDRGARSLVAAFRHGEFNPGNERLVRQAVKKEYPKDYLGSASVFLASDITFRSGLAARINTAVISAYIHDKLTRLLYKAEEELRRRQYHGILFIGHNNGAVARAAKTRAINTYNSGPAAGLAGAGLVGRLYGDPDLLSGDMGGTSFDMGFVKQGQVSRNLETDVEGLAVNLPMHGIRAIGAGGGSIAWLEDGELRVGPQSAGSLPGPACFDLGGLEPTVTDADLVLGLINPEVFLGGGMRLNRDKARQAIANKIAGPLDVSVEEAALGIRRTIDQTMGRELGRLKREVFPESDPWLLVYGGAGPGHSADLAREAGLKKIVVTPFSSVFSAYSSSGMDVGHLYYRRVDLPLDGRTGREKVDAASVCLKALAERDMRGEGFPGSQVSFEYEVFISAGDQETRLALPENGLDDLNGLAAQARALLGGDETPVLTSLGLRAWAPVPHFPTPEVPPATAPVEAALKNSRPVYLEPGRPAVNLPVYDRAGLGRGHRLTGPALVESEYTTAFIPSGWGLSVDKYDNLFIEEV